jgi:predicted ABC-type ATPase
MPSLHIIAGCNGSGKSTFAKSFLPSNIQAFDFDKVELQYYNQMQDSELRSLIAKNKAIKTFEDAISDAIKTKSDFCYETNFDTYPIDIPTRFKENNYEINIIFFCIENQEIAKHRIQVRTENNGHFVNDETIDFKWKEGYKNFNKYYSFFDKILIVDNSINNSVYTNILQIVDNKIELFSKSLPNYFQRRFPDIYKMIK